MDLSGTRSRPALVALQPRLATALQSLGMVPLELVLQPPRPTPRPHGWDILPPSSTPLLIDLNGMDLPLIAMLLGDLSRLQRERRTAPLLIVPPTAVGAQRLVANSGLSCIVASADMSAEALLPWISVSVQIGPGQVWLRLTAPSRPHLDPRLAPLLAALSRAKSIAQAAEWCYLSRRTAYTILAKTCELLGVPAEEQYRSTAGWETLLTTALTYRST